MSGFHRLAALLIALAVAEGGNGRIGAQSPSGISPALYAGLTWRCIGPFDGGPVASVEGVAGQPGIYTITTPSGGAWKTIDGGDTWTTLDRSIGTNASADPHRWVDPANPRRIARTDSKGIEVSLDAGKTWTASHHLPIAEVESLEGGKGARGRGGQINIRVADPARAGLMFAGTNTGVEVSFDNGVRWVSLHLNMPAVAINDLAIRGNNVIAATQGRSTWILEDISPLRQLTATAAAAPMTLFKPADVISSADAVALDYLIGRVPRGNVTLEVIDAAGRVVHAISSAPPDPADGWLPVTRSLSTTPGHHRVTWNLRFDPPPSPQHKYAQAARAILHEMPADPDGPRVLAGAYRVRLTGDALTQVQPLIVRSDPKVSAANLAIDRQKFQLAMKSYDALQASHRAFLQTTRLRDGLKPLLLSPDVGIVIAAAKLYMRVVSLDGSDWTGLVIPDAPEEMAMEEEEVEVKHPDFVPPKPVSVSKDYDDPASVLGRLFENVNHAPALKIISTSVGGLLTKTATAKVAPDEFSAGTFDQSCQELAAVLAEWRAMNAQDLPRINAELAKRKLPPLPVATSVPAIACRPAK